MSESIVKWINTFSGLPKPCQSIKELSDGISLYTICSQIAGKYFTGDGFKTDVGDNWILKSNNIRKLLSHLDDFYLTELGMHDRVRADPTLIGKDQNEDEIMKIIYLILGVLVESENKDEYITNIMHLDQDAQHELMVIIGAIVQEHNSHSAQNSLSESTTTIEDARISHLQAEVADLQNKLQEEMNNLEAAKRREEDSSIEIVHLKREHQNLSETVGRLQEELEREKKQAKEAILDSMSRVSASAIDDERHHAWASQLEDREATISELKKRADDLSKQAAEARTLRDELDMVREEAAKSANLEDKLKKLQQKADQVPDLKKQIKNLEEQNEEYLQKALDAEESAQKTTALKSQIEQYKQQIAALQVEQTQVEVKNKSLQGEIDRLHVNLNTLVADIESLKGRNISLQNEINDLNAEREAGFVNAMNQGEAISDESNSLVVKEKIARLERENKKLKEQQTVEADQHKNKTEELNKLNDSLTKELELLRLSKGGDAGPALATAQAELEAQRAKISQLQDVNNKQLVDINEMLKKEQDLLKNSMPREDVDERLRKIQITNEGLQSQNKKLEMLAQGARLKYKEMQEEKIKFEHDLFQKAKKELEEATRVLRVQLQERDEKIKLLERMMDEAKQNSTMELNLMTTAFHSAGLELSRKVLPATSPSTPRGFLNTMRNQIH